MKDKLEQAMGNRVDKLRRNVFLEAEKIDDRASFQTKLRLTATDLKVGHELNGKLIKRRFKICMQEKM